MSIQVRLFGSFDVEVDGRRFGSREFGGIKPKQLLELLVLQRGRLVPKDALAEALWAESPPLNAVATLESYVSVLRSRLAEARTLVVTETDGYRFDFGGARVDLDEFDALLREAAGSPPVRRRECLEGAIALAAGDVLANEPYADWVLELRGVYAERRLQALCDLGEACLILGDFEAARDRADEVLLTDPLFERCHRVAMLAHYGLGDEARALRAYRRCRSVLSEMLGVSPSPETAALHQGILHSDDVRALLLALAPPGARVPDAPAGSSSSPDPFRDPIPGGKRCRTCTRPSSKLTNRSRNGSPMCWNCGPGTSSSGRCLRTT